MKHQPDWISYSLKTASVGPVKPHHFLLFFFGGGQRQPRRFFFVGTTQVVSALTSPSFGLGMEVVAKFRPGSGLCECCKVHGIVCFSFLLK